MIFDKTYLINLVFILSFFPFIKFIPFITAEAQPIAALVAFIYLFKYSRPINKYIIFYFSIIFLYFVIALLKYLFFNSTGELLINSTIESTLILLTPILIYLVLLNNLDLVSVNTFRFVQYSWFIISILQAYFPFLLNITGVSFILTSIIPRFLSESIGGSRGVSAFAPEPSYAAQVIIVIILFGFFMYKKNQIKTKEFYFIIFADLMMIIANKSGSIYLFLILYLFFYFAVDLSNILKSPIYLIKNIFIIFTSFIVLCLLALIFIAFQLSENSRLGDAVNVVSSNNYNYFGFFDLLDITNQLGSQRTITVFVGYFNAFDTYGFGSGLGSWANNFINSLEKSGLKTDKIDFFISNGVTNLKPYSYAALLAFDTGFVGLISLSMIFVSSFFTKLNYKVSQYGWSCLFLSLFMLYFNTVASLPCAWIIYLLFYYEKRPSKIN
jgi:hypothetical protein